MVHLLVQVLNTVLKRVLVPKQVFMFAFCLSPCCLVRWLKDSVYYDLLTISHSFFGGYLIIAFWVLRHVLYYYYICWSCWPGGWAIGYHQTETIHFPQTVMTSKLVLVRRTISNYVWHMRTSFSKTTLVNLWGVIHKSPTSTLQRIEMEPWPPRWWQYCPAATGTSLWNAFLPHCPYTVIPEMNLHTQHYNTKYCVSLPVAVFAHYTHYKQFDSCCYTCIFHHEQRWCEYSATNDPFKAFCAMAQNKR